MNPNLNRLLPAGVVVVVVDVSAAGLVSVLIENGEATGAVDVVDVAPNWNPVLAGFAADVVEDDVDGVDPNENGVVEAVVVVDVGFVEPNVNPVVVAG